MAKKKSLNHYREWSRFQLAWIFAKVAFCMSFLILYKSFDQKWFVETLPVRLSSKFRCAPRINTMLIVHAVVLRRQLAQKKTIVTWTLTSGFCIILQITGIYNYCKCTSKTTYLVNVFFFVLTLLDLVWILRVFMAHLKQPKSNCLFLTPSRTRMKEHKSCLI